jgi:hypothetical protein
MDLTEMTEHLEGIARSEEAPPSARVRAIEVLFRIDKTRRRMTRSGSASSSSSGTVLLSEAAERRLVLYCRRGGDVRTGVRLSADRDGVAWRYARPARRPGAAWAGVG